MEPSGPTVGRPLSSPDTEESSPAPELPLPLLLLLAPPLLLLPLPLLVLAPPLLLDPPPSPFTDEDSEPPHATRMTIDAPRTVRKADMKDLLARDLPRIQSSQWGRRTLRVTRNRHTMGRNLLPVPGHSESVNGSGPAQRTAARRDDFHLAQRCVSGDRMAQRELFQRERRRVHVILYRVLGSNADMEDLLQETFIEIFRSIPNFRGEAALGTWLDRIAVRVAYAHLTRRRLEIVRLSVVPEPLAREPGADERAMTRQAAARLYDALDRIPAAQRIAFTLHVVDGRPVKQVAQTMEASVVATKVRIWRAWRAIRKAAQRDALISDLLNGGGPGQGPR
jgi:RNA polymerase sigma-70 factor (ECF subfamily)